MDKEETHNIFISNCCLGKEVHDTINKCKYNNPFIAT